MSQCPVCAQEIQDSFGLVECTSCHKILFADFDGSLKIHEEGKETIPSNEIATYELEEEHTHSEGFNNEWNLVSETPAPPLDTLDPVVEPMPIQEDVEQVLEEPHVALGMVEEINSFANSEDSNLKQGSLIYNLTIKNIDTEELKDEILEVLSEHKLNIDIKRLKFALPTLELKDLNPVKASVIVSKIKHLPVNVEWAQKSAITNEESKLD